MKLFMIWYLTGEIVLLAGPLPYGLLKCQARADSQMAEIVAKDTTGAMTGLDIKCEFRETKPKLGDKQ